MGSTTSIAKGQLLPVPKSTTPYWRWEPHELDNVRTTKNLPPKCDIVIIGSGLAGISTAYYLLHENENPPNIVILEARQLCSGATGRNGGHCKVKINTLTSLISKTDAASADQLQNYVLGVMQRIKHIVEEEDLKCEFELRRSFDVQVDSADTERLKSAFDKSRVSGQAWTKVVSFLDGKNVEQITSIKGAQSAFCVPACSFWPYKFVTQLLARLLARHSDRLNVQTTTPVTSVKFDEMSGNNIVETKRGTLKAHKVIFASNAYTAGLLPQYRDIIIPYKGMACHIMPNEAIHPHLSNTYNIDFGSSKGVDYLNPRPNSGIVVGGANWLIKHKQESWFNNWDDSTRFTPDVEAYWEGYMQRNFLGWEESGAHIDRVWVGIMGHTSDESPHVGRVPGIAHQWILAGFNGGGMALILTAAKAVSEMVRENREFEEVALELGVPQSFGTSEERLKLRTAGINR